MDTQTPTPDPAAAGTRPQSVAAFELSLQGRTKVPLTEVFALWEGELHALGEALDATNHILARFARAVSDAAESDAAADDFLRELDLKLISEDHNWRAIFSTIRHQKIWTADHKRTALESYLQYLGFRKRLLNFIIDRQANLAETGRWFFCNQVDLEEGTALSEYVALPEGSPVTLDLREGRMVPVWLAGNRFMLIASQPASLLTDKGLQLTFPRHRNVVGRHPSADVPIPGEYTNVSRAHALVEWDSPFVVTITDLSTNGTLLHAKDYERLVRLPN